MTHTKLFLKLILLSFLLINCNKEDDSNDIDEVALNVTSEQIEGIWAIFQIKFENKTSDAPISVEECGRNFFNFSPNGKYSEFVFNNSNCIPVINTVSWSLSNGIITFTDEDEDEKDEWTITELTEKGLVVKFNFDANSDGTPEVFYATCKRYTPPNEMDVYTQSFSWEDFVGTDNKILFKWDNYKGYNEFSKYEIYRFGENCNQSQGEIIATITDVDKNSFVDLTPPPLDNLCYRLKIYTNKGLLGESPLINVTTSRVTVPLVDLEEPTLNNSEITLNWSKYDGYYFSHYEIEVRNNSTGSGSEFEKEIVTIIDDINTTNLVIEQPFFNNPVFVIRAYNIFGSTDGFFIESKNQRSTNFKRDEILPVDRINFSIISDNETILYYSDYSSLYKYNYTTNSIENQIELNSSSIIFIKMFKSLFGTEIIVNKGNTLKVYDHSLNFKYDLDIETSNFLFQPEHLIVTKNNYWLITSREKLYTFSRVDNKLTQISVTNLYNETFSSSLINLIDIEQNRILTGNFMKDTGLLVNINENGELSSSIPNNIKTTSQWKNDALFSKDKDYLLNREDNTLYSTNSFELITQLNPKLFVSGISNDGSLFLGTNNSPKISNGSFHEKKVRTYSFPNFHEKEYNTKGYPGIVYQNHLGQLVSISTGLIGSVSNGFPGGSIFVEVIDIE